MKNTMTLGAAIMGLCLSGLIQAQTLTPEQARQDALDHCNTLTAEAKTNCTRDANAAFNQAKNQRMHTPSPTENNRLSRCDALPESKKADCIAQMTGQHDTQVYGSVEGGGVLRKTTIVIPGQPQQPAQTSIIESAPATFPMRE